MLSPLSAPVVTTFVALAAAMLALWAPRVWFSPHARSLWVLPFAVALLAAQMAEVVTTPGLVAMFVLITATRSCWR